VQAKQAKVTSRNELDTAIPGSTSANGTKQHGLSFLNYNVCGLLSKLNSPDLIHLIQNNDIITLTETFLKTDIDPCILQDFVVYSSLAKKLSKQGRYSGGVSVLVKKSLGDHVERVQVKEDNTVAVKISKDLMGTSKDVMYVSMYMPPYDSNFWNTCMYGYGLELLENCITDLYSKHNDCFIFFSGDLNARTAENNYSGVDPEDFEDMLTTNKEKMGTCMFERYSHDKERNIFGEQLLEFCNVYDCVILNGLVEYSFDDSYTYVGEAGSSVIDYFVASVELLNEWRFRSLSVGDLVDSDHLPVQLSILSGKRPSCNDSKEDRKITGDHFQKMIWENEKEAMFKEKLQNEQNTALLLEASKLVDNDIDAAITIFVKCLNEASQCMVKTCRQSTVQNAPWFDLECKNEKKTCKRLLKIFRKTRSENNRREYVESRNKYKRMLRNKKIQFRANMAQSISGNIGDSSLFWKELKKLGGLSQRKVKNDISMDTWYQHFKDVFSQGNTNKDNASERDYDVIEDEASSLNQPISKEEIIEAVKLLKCNKAPGPDGVIAEMIKIGAPVTVDFLVKLFNHVFATGVYPREWAKAIVVPIHKKGNVNEPDNYRGVSLINIISKCYTSILNRRLNTWLQNSEKIVENQAGFRKNYSTTDNIFTLHSVVQKCMNIKGRKLYVAFVDLKRAFDSVNHELLLEVVNTEGVKGKFFLSLKSMYESLISCVRSGTECSEYFDCPVGVRQGCVLSPTLFSVFINQLANSVNESGIHGVQFLPTLVELFILLFADDIVLLSTTPGGLQVQLNCLKDCCDRLKLTVNLDKTKIIVFRKGGYLSKREKWNLYGKEVEVVNSYCYLGFTFTTMLSYKIGTSHLITKAKKAVYLITRAFNNCKDMSQQVFFKMFDAKVQSILLYSAEIWGLNKLDTLEKVHLAACKIFLGVPTRTPNIMVYQELQRYPLYINTYIRSLKYWFKLLRMDIARLPKQAYVMMGHMDNEGKTCWVTQVKNVLCHNGFAHVWMNQGVGDEKFFIRVFRQRILDLCKQEHFSVLRDRPRYTLYNSIDYGLESVDYLNGISTYCFRVAFAQTRMGVLPINNNVHRYGNCPIDKLCPFCMDAIEDELHVLLHCPLYVDLRKKFIPSDTKDLSFHKLLNGTNKRIYLQVSKYIFYVIKRRQKWICGQ
jgi:hypothetical protein